MDQELVEIQPGKVFLAGIDVGSTTTKIAAVDPENGEVVYSDYRRHHAEHHSCAGGLPGEIPGGEDRACADRIGC